jgi:hypothetical protein
MGREGPSWAESVVVLSNELNVRSSDGKPLRREEIYNRSALP